MRPEAGGRGGPRRHTHGGPVLTTGQLSKAAVEDNSTEACAPGQAWSVPGPGAVSKLRFCGCLPLENQYLRDKRWRGKERLLYAGSQQPGKTVDGGRKSQGHVLPSRGSQRVFMGRLREQRQGGGLRAGEAGARQLAVGPHDPAQTCWHPWQLF